jgi:uncharacterized protein YjiS (DUF1127 family)
LISGDALIPDALPASIETSAIKPDENEMIMSTIISTTGIHLSPVCESLSRMGAALKHAWDRYHAWRIQGATIACLRSLSDQQLDDIGLTRAQIDSAVRGALDSHPHIARGCRAWVTRFD